MRHQQNINEERDNSNWMDKLPEYIDSNNTYQQLITDDNYYFIGNFVSVLIKYVRLNYEVNISPPP